MSYRAPTYTPLCNHHLRFYLSDPRRLDFQSSVDEKQFRAVEQVLADAPAEELAQLKAVMLTPRRTNDLTDSYIPYTLRSLNYTDEEVDEFYRKLSAINKRVAIVLGYIPGRGKRKEWITWTANF